MTVNATDASWSSRAWEMLEPPKEVPVLWVGCDLDGPHYDFAYNYHRGLVTAGFVEARDYVPPPVWDFYKDQHKQTTQDFLAACAALADLGLLWEGSYHDTDAWRDLVMYRNLVGGRGVRHDSTPQLDVRIHVVTDRSFGSHPKVSESATLSGLRRAGMVYDKITFTAEKATVADELDTMLDDKLENYDDLDAAGVQVWLLDKPWNQDPGDTRRRVYSVDEYVTRVKARGGAMIRAARTA